MRNIREVVKSIAVILETITRTVYIKECGTLLEVAEPILYHEVNKLRQQKSFQDRNKYPGPEDLPVPPPVLIKPAKQDTVSLYSEKEIIRLLLKFGNAESMVKMTEMIAKGEGFGQILGLGSAAAAKAIGRGTEEFLITSKGQEAPAHMPQMKRTLALIYAVNPFGADHQRPAGPGGRG